MADDDKVQPSLELPSLLGGRKRSVRKVARRPATPVTPVSPVTPASPVAEVADVDTTREQPVTEVPQPVSAIPERPVFDDNAVAPPTPDEPATPRKPVKPVKAAKPAKVRTPRSERKPLLAGRIAALVTGVIVGGALLGLTVLGFQGCEAIRGTSSCGTAPGMVFLVVIFALAVIGGRLLLALFKVPDPGSTSFLAVGLTAVVALLFFVDQLDTWPMIIVIPALSAATYLMSWWVTTTYVEPHQT